MGEIKYVQLESSSFLSDPDFQLMNATERGVYCTVIFYMYLNDGKIQNDPERIKTLTNSGESFEKSWNCVKKKFTEKRGYLTHKRVRKELAKAKKYFQTQRRAGLIGAEKRWGGHSDPNESDIAEPMANKVKESKRKKNKEYTEEFLDFWNKYPYRWIKESGKKVKVGKQLAWERWQKIDTETRKQILEIVLVFARQIDSQSVPDAWRWLRDKKYLDYITEPTSAQKPKIDEKKEQENLEEKRQQIRDEDSLYYREKSVEELQAMLCDPGLTSRHWLIKEILEK